MTYDLLIQERKRFNICNNTAEDNLNARCDHFNIKKVFLLGLNAEQDSRSEMLVKLLVDAGNKKAVVLREKQGERSENDRKKTLHNGGGQRRARRP